MKCVGYIRVSKEEQTHGFSLEAQRERLQKYADENGMVMCGVYADEGISASKALHKRKAILQLLDDAEAGMFDVILFKDLTRWSRNPSQFYAVQERLDRCHVSWIAVEQPQLETVTAQGRLLVGIFISVASHESAQIGERIRFVNESRVKDGGVLGGDRSLPLGYKIGTIDGKKRVVVNEDEREMVKTAFDTYESQQSVVAVQRCLQGFGVYRTEQAVRAMLKCEMFTGRFHGVDDYCEPIISKEQFDHVQTIRSQRHYTPPKSSEGYVFSSLIRCRCGRRMVGTTNKKWHYYYCKGHKDGLCDNQHSVSELKLEKFMIDHINDAVSKYNVTLVPKNKKKNFAQLKAKLDRLNDLYIDGRINRQVYEQKRAEIEKNMVNDAPKSPISVFTDGWKEYYLNAPKQARNNAWRSVIDHITPNEDGTFEITFL